MVSAGPPGTVPTSMKLLTPYRLGRIDLANRIVMAPMTRSRALGNVPTSAVANYYQQRATAGLIVTEGTAPSPNGLGYARIPGVYNDAQVAGWRRVAGAVHGEAGRIFVQLMHTGRVAHQANLPAGARVVAPSAIAAPGEMYTDAQGMQPHTPPTAMSLPQIREAIGEFAHAARSAIAAGLDGIELHGANGYLLEQFLNTASNVRTDAYGGSIENRIRFVVEVTEAVAAAIGPDRVGIRLSPYGTHGGMIADPDTKPLYLALARELARIGIVYVHLVDHSSMGAPDVPAAMKSGLRKAFGGTVILSGGYDRDRAEADLEAKRGDLVAFGRPFIANPTLVAKLREGRPLTQPDPATFYTPDLAGYVDYPAD